ncbi:MAG: 23S rRNA (uracil(1939)-C(5))-methyltransferase RlmD [Ruminococcaceae bacterium]|nr:23S rRNA (uracil(1939)-C(5))-methyltransferase RlmD [Oscillospiraceae bacterium]
MEALKKNDEIKLNIEAMTSEGSAVSHYNGMAVFVRGAVPGDELIAHIIKVSKSYCIATVKELISQSPSRIESDCPVSSKCGGCSLRNMTYEEELKYKKERVIDAIKRIGHLDVPVMDIISADDINHYRNKAQYPVYIENGELKAGFYAYKSHRIIPCADCLLQQEEFEECIKAFALWVKKADITSYDEKTGKGLLRHIFLRKAVATGEIMACAVINAESLPNKELLIEELKKIEGMKSICVNVNTKKSNVILGDKTKIIRGSETICDELLGKKFEISPDSFYQVNHSQCEKLYSKAIQYAALSGGETLVDLYCGAGTIGLSMAENAKQLYGIEIVESAIKNARRNAEINNISNAQFICADALNGAKQLQAKGIKTDIVVLDPPRKGCDKELFDVIKILNPKRIVYVSCDSATLARDLAILDEKGYKALEATPVDMFPRTTHVECVVLLSRE